MHGLRRVQENRRGAGAAKRSRNLTRDVSGFSNAGHHHLARMRQDQIDRADERAIEPLRRPRDRFGFNLHGGARGREPFLPGGLVLHGKLYHRTLQWTTCARVIRRSSALSAVLLLACGILAAEVRTLTILHLNDLHAHISPENGRGGFAYLATAITRERANCIDCILLNAGDLVQGSPVSTIFHGAPIYELANLLGFDAATLGNHEFDYGWAQARNFTETARYPIVTANVVNAAGMTLTPKAYVILKVNGLRVAVIGGMTDTLKSLATPNSLGEWHTTPVVAAVRKYAAELQEPIRFDCAAGSYRW